MKKQGKLIVIDGTDGSGKATQTKLLVNHLKQEGYPVTAFSFPQYNQKSAGPIEEYLSGKYGPAETVGPYRASILYAIDRYDASNKIKTKLAEGQIVIADRYVGSNMGHQGAQIKDPQERLKFYEWNDQLEHQTFNIPRPDLNIILHVPAQISSNLIKQRNDAKGGIEKPILDKLELLQSAEQAYLDIVQRFPTFQLIECTKNEQMLNREEIHQLIWQMIKKII